MIRLILQQFLGGEPVRTVIRQDQPHFHAAAHGDAGGLKTAAEHVLSMLHVLLHVGDCAFPVRREKRSGSGIVFLEAVPLDVQVQGGDQSHDGVRIHADTVDVLLRQEAVGRVPDPDLKRLVVAGRAHLAAEGRGKVRVRQCLYRVFVIGEPLIQPERIGKDAFGLVRIEGIREVNGRGLLPQCFDTVRAEQLQDLRPAFAAGALREHREGHITVQGRVDAVRVVSFRFRAAQDFRHTVRKEIGKREAAALDLAGLLQIVRRPASFRVFGFSEGIGFHDQPASDMEGPVQDQGECEHGQYRHGDPEELMFLESAGDGAEEPSDPFSKSFLLRCRSALAKCVQRFFRRGSFDELHIDAVQGV